jgi:hypothetical protein
MSWEIYRSIIKKTIILASSIWGWLFLWPPNLQWGNLL